MLQLTYDDDDAGGNVLCRLTGQITVNIWLQ